MLPAFLILISFELLGELLRSALSLPVPGPVIGMFLLATGLACRDRGKEPAETPAPSSLDRMADRLLEHMGLLFVPAGVGIIARFGLLRQQWIPIAIGLVGSTVLSLMVTGFVMHRIIRAPTNVAKATPPIDKRTGVTQ